MGTFDKDECVRGRTRPLEERRSASAKRNGTDRDRASRRAL